MDNPGEALFVSIGENVLNPAINAAIIDPINYTNCAVRLGLSRAKDMSSVPDILPRLPVPACKIFSPAWFAQNLAGGFGSVLPYALSGKLAGGALRLAGCRLQLTGSTAGICKSDAIAQVCGGVVYDAIRTPQIGESRVGNSVAGAVGFSVYESGNALSRRFALPSRIAMRGMVGTAGGAIQRATGEFIATGKLSNPQNLAESAVSGALLNIVLPGGQLAFDEAINQANFRLGRGVPVDKYLNRYSGMTDWRTKSPTLAFLVRDSWSRIQPRSTLNNYDLQKDLIRVTTYGDPLITISNVLSYSKLLKMRAGSIERLARVPAYGSHVTSWHDVQSALFTQELLGRSINQRICNELGLGGAV